MTKGNEGPAASDADGKELGDRLRAGRARAGMTRKQLASRSQTSERYLAHLEAGVGNPSLAMLITLARALDLAVADLLPDNGERNPTVGNLVGVVRRLPVDRLATLAHWLDAQTPEASSKARRIVLLGLRGAGKSTLGAELATRLGFPFYEISKEVERDYGGRIGLLIELGGQGSLRRLEEEVWERIVSRQECAVIAAPGGIVANGPLYSRVLESAHSIWLQASPEDHMNRVIEQGDMRPMAANRAAMSDLRLILASRAGDYARADAQLNTSAQGFAATADALELRSRAILADTGSKSLVK